MECEYMSDRDFAEMLGLSLRYVQKMFRKGNGPESFKIGRQRRIRQDVAMQWIEDHSTRPCGEK